MGFCFDDRNATRVDATGARKRHFLVNLRRASDGGCSSFVNVSNEAEKPVCNE